MTSARNRGLFLALVGVAALWAATHVAYRPAPPLGADASPYLFSAQRAKSVLHDLLGNGVPHPIGSPDAARVRDLIVRRLSALGYATQLQSGVACNDEGVCGKLVNIIATLGSGFTDADADAVLLSAHYDSVAAGPGASDDGAAVATVLEIARILTLRPAPRHPIVLLLNEGEEAGLLGALLFVREHPLSKAVKAAVNLDARGTSGASLMFETGSANAWAMTLFASVIPRLATNSLYYVGYELLPNDTDFTVYKAAGYQGFNFAYIGNVGRYHTPLDSWANASASSIQQQGDAALASLWAMANADSLRPAVGESVYFDVLARALVAWPAAASLPAAIAALLLLLAQTMVLLRKRLLTGRQLLWGWVGTLGMTLSGVALTTGILTVLIAVGKVPPIDGESWIAHPLPMSIAAAAIALLVCVATGALLARRAGFWGFWTASSLLAAVLAVTCAVPIPGAGYVILLAAAAAGVAGLPAMVVALKNRIPTGWTVDAAAVIPSWVIFALLVALPSFLYTALGSVAWPVSTLLLCLGAAAVLPLVATAGRRARRRIMMLMAVVVVGSTLATLILPTYSADWPERLNFEYWLDLDAAQAQWLAQTGALKLPAPILRVAEFDPVARPRFPGSSAPRFHAAASARVIAGPELLLEAQAAPSAPSVPMSAHPSALPPPLDSQTVTGASATATRHFDLRLRSPRGASAAAVVFPAGAKISDIVVMTPAGPSRSKLHRLKNGATLLDVVGLGSEGFAFSVDAAGGAPLTVRLFDQSYDFAGGEFLQRARPPEAASSQDGDLTVVTRTVSLDPAPGR